MKPFHFSIMCRSELFLKFSPLLHLFLHVFWSASSMVSAIGETIVSLHIVWIMIIHNSVLIGSTQLTFKIIAPFLAIPSDVHLELIILFICHLVESAPKYSPESSKQRNTNDLPYSHILLHVILHAWMLASLNCISLSVCVCLLCFPFYSPTLLSIISVSQYIYI